MRRMSYYLDQYKKKVSILKRGYVQEAYRINQISKSLLGKKTPRNITTVDIAKYRDQRLLEINPRTKKQISPATVRLEMSLLSHFFDIARIEWGICDSNPVSNVRKPKPAPGRDRRLTAREERLILRYCFNHSNSEIYSIVVIALETAMRQGEILQLKWEHVNLKTRIAHLPETKNGTKRDVPLSIKAKDALVRMGVKSSGKVFDYTANGLKSTWRFMLKKLSIEDLHFHDLRHEAVSRLFELGTLDMMEIAHISGHKSLSMLKRYTHLKSGLLVKKLEGNRHRGRQTVITHLIPYPACIEKDGESNIKLRILDFEDLEVSAPCRDSAIRIAQDALLRRIVSLMKASEAIPQPDQYLELIDEKRLVMVDPLASEMA